MSTGQGGKMIDTAELARWQPPMFDTLTRDEHEQLFVVLYRGGRKLVDVQNGLLRMDEWQAATRVTSVLHDINELLHDLNDSRRVTS